MYNYKNGDSHSVLSALRTNQKTLKRWGASPEALAFTARGIDGERDCLRLTVAEWPKDRELERLIERLRGPKSSLADRIDCGRELKALVDKLGEVIGASVKRAHIKPTSPNGLWNLATERGREIAREAIMGVGTDGKASKRRWDPTGGRTLRSWVGLLVERRAITLSRDERRGSAKRSPIEVLELAEHEDTIATPGPDHLCERNERHELGPQFLHALRHCNGGRHAGLAERIDNDTTNALRTRTYAAAANILKALLPERCAA